MSEIVAKARSAYNRHQDRKTGLRSRVKALEAEVQEQRELNRRIAELTDVVAELLIPLQDQDRDRVEQVLKEYRAKI